MTFTPLTGVDTQTLTNPLSFTEITTLEFVANPVEVDAHTLCKPKQEDCGDLTPVKISDLPTLDRTPGDNDLILIYDTSEKAIRAITFANLRASTVF